MDVSTKLLYGMVALTIQVILQVSSADLYGMHIGLTVDDLDKSTSYYTDIMGGMEVTKLSTCVFGDTHYYRMFQKEVLAAAVASKTSDEYGVPDIRDNGDKEVNL